MFENLLTRDDYSEYILTFSAEVNGPAHAGKRVITQNRCELIGKFAIKTYSRFSRSNATDCSLANFRLNDINIFFLGLIAKFAVFPLCFSLGSDRIGMGPKRNLGATSGGDP